MSMLRITMGKRELYPSLENLSVEGSVNYIITLKLRLLGGMDQYEYLNKRRHLTWKKKDEASLSNVDLEGVDN